MYMEAFTTPNILVISSDGDFIDAIHRMINRGEVVSNHERECFIPHKTFSGNRPSLSILLPELNAYNVRQLLAIYEYRVAVQVFIWGINSFELGKVLATQVRKQLHSPRTQGTKSRRIRFQYHHAFETISPDKFGAADVKLHQTNKSHFLVQSNMKHSSFSTVLYF
ncbi:unnamed protein product [Arabis nemorensis]|uniref:Glucose-6-phosphate isomerase n=1 Tax=Arabis nemorensis TaxID=586526 RepID=A0A565BGB0_9BRAS|nr:unnamed protein product [Arabis nemorensis]